MAVKAAEWCKLQVVGVSSKGLKALCAMMFFLPFSLSGKSYWTLSSILTPTFGSHLGGAASRMVHKIWWRKSFCSEMTGWVKPDWSFHSCCEEGRFQRGNLWFSLLNFLVYRLMVFRFWVLWLLPCLQHSLVVSSSSLAFYFINSSFYYDTVKID